MDKIKTGFIIDQYRSGVENYAKYTTEVGLWASEQYVFEKYFLKSDHILDLGCGTGRTTFPLYQMGYQNIQGVDLTPEMIQSARKLNHHYQTSIKFEIGDATALVFPDNSFDAVLFSFNGLMSIPGQVNRDKAFGEIHRVLKAKGTFIFTTHDRNKDEKFLPFWEDERKRWDKGERDERLYEFGDRITHSKNEEQAIFIHIPDKEEIIRCLDQHKFELLETFYRSDRFTENERVERQSGECRFWVVEKR